MPNISTVRRSFAGARKLLPSDQFVLASLVNQSQNIGLAIKGASFSSNSSGESSTINIRASPATTNRTKSDGSNNNDEEGVTTSSSNSNADKWADAIHPFQEPYWTGRQDPSDYLGYMEESTMPHFRQRRRKHDLILLRQAEQVVWQVELMKRAYQEYVSSDLRTNNDSTATPCAEGCNRENEAAEAARQRYNDCRQEALEARMEFMRVRRLHIKGKNHYKYAMQNFPIPEALSDSDSDQ